jgi:hypothetical protein
MFNKNEITLIVSANNNILLSNFLNIKYNAIINNIEGKKIKNSNTEIKANGVITETIELVK